MRKRYGETVKRGYFVTFDALADEVTNIVLHPFRLSDMQGPLHRRGVPVAATEEDAAATIARASAASEIFGTAIEYRDGLGYVKLGNC